MKITLKNVAMMNMLDSLQPILSHKDKIGYVAARNHRILENCLTEFIKFRDNLIEKYGELDTDADGNETGTITIRKDSPNFKKFIEELEPYCNIEHEVELMLAKYDEAIGCLSGEEILSIDWMLED